MSGRIDEAGVQFQLVLLFFVVQIFILAVVAVRHLERIAFAVDDLRAFLQLDVRAFVREKLHGRAVFDEDRAFLCREFVRAAVDDHGAAGRDRGVIRRSAFRNDHGAAGVDRIGKRFAAV